MCCVEESRLDPSVVAWNLFQSDMDHFMIAHASGWQVGLHYLVHSLAFYVEQIITDTERFGLMPVLCVSVESF